MVVPFLFFQILLQIWGMIVGIIVEDNIVEIVNVDKLFQVFPSCKLPIVISPILLHLVLLQFKKQTLSKTGFLILRLRFANWTWIKSIMAIVHDALVDEELIY